MALYRFNTPALELAWPDVTQWSVQSRSANEVMLSNSDGTHTLLSGHGFAYDAAGDPVGGTILSLQRLDADGATVLERINGLHVSLDDARAALDTNGFVDTFLSGDDRIMGTDDYDFYLYSGAGNDIVFGGAGGNVFFDGPGSDLYVGGRTSFNIDWVFDAVDYSASPYAIDVFLTGGVNSRGSHVTFDDSSDVDTLVNMETFDGGALNDTFTIDQSFVNKEGTGRTWIEGNGGNDTINGNGEVLLFYFRAEAAVYASIADGTSYSLNDPVGDPAGIGIDSFSGVYALYGSSFDDVLIGSDSGQTEFFDGGRGSDTIDGRGGFDIVGYDNAPPFGLVVDLQSGFAQIQSPLLLIDLLVGIEGVIASDFDGDITMDDADNLVIGSNGNDSIRGLGGNDSLFGDASRFNVYNAPGNDTLVGGEGADTLTGNDGQDVFRFEADDDSTPDARDVITDLVQGADTIDLAPIGAIQPLEWIGQDAFTGQAGQLHFIRDNQPGQANDRTIVEADLDGNGAADFQIELRGLYNLTIQDFRLS
jgi:Ca2+-binding RTX toxin-like protein